MRCCACNVQVVSFHTPFSIHVLRQAVPVVRPENTPRLPLAGKAIYLVAACARRGYQNRRVSGTTTTALALHSARRCSTGSTVTDGGKQNPNARVVHPSTTATSCANTSTPAESWQWYLEKNGKRVPPGATCADLADAMRST